MSLTLAPTPNIARVTDDLTRLVASAAKGDDLAWSALVDRFSGLVWHVVRGFRLPDAVAEDAYQTTWLRLTEHLERIREPESLAGWLARTARNECLRTIRLQERETPTSDTPDPTDPGPEVDTAVMDEVRDTVIWRAFATLSDACKQLLRLLMADPPVPYETISEMLDMPIGSIGPTRARCLQKLRGADGVQLLRG